MNRLRILGSAGALVAAALIGGTVISATLAADDADTEETRTTAAVGLVDSEYADAYLDTLAEELGVEREALGPAALAAVNAAIDAAVAAGDLDEDRAATMKERLADLDDPAVLLVRGFHRHDGPRIGPGVGIAIGNIVESAADALGVDVDDVIEAFRDGDSLQEQAEAQGVDYATVTSAVLAAAKTELDDEVADEDLGQDRADALYERLEAWLENGGEPLGGRLGPGLGHRGPFGFGR